MQDNLDRIVKNFNAVQVEGAGPGQSGGSDGATGGQLEKVSYNSASELVLI